ncbi:branched-chain amino acid transport system substrate-binding protein [Rhodoligotrophos appendicifer]|uniref:ABC transporter substrate-binding protein n=1 Tax=Rhodoligotrophos appendicifer TaxID=987056 RepID=UPI0014792608|nr:ABC transporter substrate-binding protein [Rhodoligotrophos appendicifer]
MKVLRTAFAALLCLVAQAGLQSAVAQEPVRIGLIDDQSSVYSGLGGKGTVIAVQMAIEDFGGKALGQPIEFRSADHLNQPDLALSLASAWLDRDKFDVILGGGSSAALLAVQNMMKAKPTKTLMVTGSSNLDFAGKACTENSMQFAPNNYVLLAPTIKALTDQDQKKWYLLSSDNAGGKTARSVATKKLEQFGGSVSGTALFPLDSTDFSSFLLQAQATTPQVLGLSTSGSPLVALVKQSREFGLQASGIQMALLAAFITDIHSIGLEAAQGLVFSTIFYWDRNEKTRDFAKRFFAKDGGMPTQMHAAAYAATIHYLQAVETAKTADATKVIPLMREKHIDNPLFEDAYVREDGAVIWPAYFVQVKTPAESKDPWDYYTIKATISGQDANLSIKDQGCPRFAGQ